MSMDLRDRLYQEAKMKGARFFGVADLEPAREFIVEQGGNSLSGYPLAVSVGYQLIDGTVDELHRHEDAMAVSTYWYHVYQMVNHSLDSIALGIAQEIQQAGYRATVVPSSYTVNTASLVGLFSHKLAAHLAGLGWIGKSALLITPECGARARWCTVLTDAPLLADQPFPGEKCGGCSRCVDICPVQAFTGAAYDVIRSRSELFAAGKCYEYLLQRRNTVGCFTCGLCVYSCPYGQRRTAPPGGED